MPKTLLSLPALILAASLAACAGQGPAPEFEGAPGGRGMTLFISPSGQPFRAGPGEPYPSATWFAEADKDHDGRLTLAEFRADAEGFFHSLDTNKDGVVDGFENAAYEKSLPELAPRIRQLQAGEGMNMNLGKRGGGEFEGGGGGGGRRRGGAGGREGAGLFSYFYDPQPVSAADTDFSSRITLAEAAALADRRFTQLDTLRAGYLTLAALPKTPVQAAAEARAKDRRRNGGPPGVEQAPGPDRTRSAPLAGPSNGPA